ncbi:MAG TPA: hypothetical protein VGK18_04575 [Propionicimonas sp.]|jgi:hypothetical protein|uniref:hypothetical protein n=1 Tax=Propionicimonas sp. TaxID=1955623 RepID=UPI002F408CA9
MSSPALSRTRVALGILMATATLATTGIAGTLALSRHTGDSDTAEKASGGTTTPATQRVRHQKTTTTGNFSPASKPSSTTAPSHTKTKGS